MASQEGWENSITYISNWYGHNHPKNCTKSVTNQAQTKARVELAAILLALLTNKNAELTIKSSSLTMINAICYRTKIWEDKLWIESADNNLFKAIIHELCTQPKPCSFQWPRKNSRNKDPNVANAEKLTKDNQVNREEFNFTPKDYDNSRALHDGARLLSLELKDAYKILITQKTSKIPPLLHPERLETAKDSIEAATGLCPTDWKLMMKIWKIPVYPRL